MTEPLPGFRLLTRRVGTGLDWPGSTVAADNRLDAPDGGVTLVLAPPQQRRWVGDVLHDCVEVDYELAAAGDGATLRAPADTEVDLLELSGEAAAAWRGDVAAPATVVGSFTRLDSAADLGRFLVGGRVLDTHDFSGRRCPSEQTAFSLWRLARLRGGSFWSAVADHVTSWVEQRVTAAAGGLPVHDVNGNGETHTRFLTDAALLLLATGRTTAGDRALDAIEAMAVTDGDPAIGGGRWVLHDTDERAAGRNDLVLNTQLHATLALLAAGRDVSAYQRATDALLSRQPPFTAATLARAGAHWLGTGLVSRGGTGWLEHRAAVAAARHAAADRWVRDPGGHLARDATAKPIAHYLTVNLYDLAMLTANQPTAATVRALRGGLRWARSTGAMTRRPLGSDPLSLLVPAVLRVTGAVDAAQRLADRLRSAGLAPTHGWPGHLDRPVAALAWGTP